MTRVQDLRVGDTVRYVGPEWEGFEGLSETSTGTLFRSQRRGTLDVQNNDDQEWYSIDSDDWEVELISRDHTDRADLRLHDAVELIGDSWPQYAINGQVTERISPTQIVITFDYQNRTEESSFLADEENYRVRKIEMSEFTQIQDLKVGDKVRTSQQTWGIAYRGKVATITGIKSSPAEICADLDFGEELGCGVANNFQYRVTRIPLIDDKPDTTKTIVDGVVVQTKPVATVPQEVVQALIEDFLEEKGFRTNGMHREDNGDYSFVPEITFSVTYSKPSHSLDLED